MALLRQLSIEEAPPLLPTEREIFTPEADEAVTEKLKKVYHFPELSRLSKGREHTFILGGTLQVLLDTDRLEQAAAVAAHYAFFGYGEIEEINLPHGSLSAAEYHRFLLSSRFLLEAFTTHLVEPEKPSMLLGDLPKATHSFLVARRAAKIPWPQGGIDDIPWREIGRIVMLDHDQIEDTRTPLRGPARDGASSLEMILQEVYGLAERPTKEGVIASVLGGVELLTRSDLFYVFLSQRILGLMDNFPTEHRLIAAIVKQEDRYVNNRSIEPFLDEKFPFRKVIKELGKSLWVADYIGKNMLHQLSDPESTDEQHAFRVALRHAVIDNLRSLYGSIIYARTELEERIRDEHSDHSEQFTSSIKRNVANYGRAGGFGRITAPKRLVRDVLHSHATDGTLIKVFSLMYPGADEIKEAAAASDDPHTESALIKRRILAGSPGWLLPVRYVASIDDKSVHRIYSRILNQQEWSKELFTQQDWQYLTIYVLQKTVELHLSSNYSILRPQQQKEARGFPTAKIE